VSKVQQKHELSKYAQEIHSAAAENIRKYQFKSRRKNPEWSVEKLISLRSCHIHNNATSENALNEFLQTVKQSDIEEVFISRIPKYLTTLEKPISVDTGTGEIIYEDYNTDDFKASRNRKIKTVEKFCNYYEPLYKTRKISLLFHTFTRFNYAKKDMRRMVEQAKRRYNSLNRPIRGFIWVLEISETNHIHYHFIVAIDRIRWKKIPDELKFEDLWGQRTGVEFIIKGIKCYLTKYLYKSDARILGKRSYSISRHLN